jgi:RNase P/RNase MRP subunit POP5
MKLLPSLKQKKRYIIFEVSEKVSELDLKEEVSQALFEFVGTLGVSKMSPLFVKYKNNKFIMKINHKYVDEAKSALILIKTIKNKPVTIKSIITSGTIKKASLSL